MKDISKSIIIFSAILIMMIFTNVSIKNDFKIENEEIAKSPIYALATIGAIGNVAGGIIQDATELITEFNLIDIKEGLPLRFLANETKKYLNLPIDEYIKKANEIWNNLPWWKQTYYSIGTIGAPMNIRKYWQENQ